MIVARETPCFGQVLGFTAHGQIGFKIDEIFEAHAQGMMAGHDQNSSYGVLVCSIPRFWLFQRLPFRSSCWSQIHS